MEPEGGEKKSKTAFVFDADTLGFAMAVLLATGITALGFYREISWPQIIVRAAITGTITYVAVYMLANFALNTAQGEAMERRRALAEKVMAGVSVPEGTTTPARETMADTDPEKGMES